MDEQQTQEPAQEQEQAQPLALQPEQETPRGDTLQEEASPEVTPQEAAPEAMPQDSWYAEHTEPPEVSMPKRRPVIPIVLGILAGILVCVVVGLGTHVLMSNVGQPVPASQLPAVPPTPAELAAAGTDTPNSNKKTKKKKELSPGELRAKLDITEDYRDEFAHGRKGKKYQKYLVLHDTESTKSAEEVVDWWASNGNLIAAHFVVDKDGSIVQCVGLNKIAHHAGYGDTGNNEKYGVEDESRDDKLGTQSQGSAFADYGMNSYSIGIEMVHAGTEHDYPKAQLKALDKLIAYLDAYYGRKCKIIDHKMWRSDNPDTSDEFAEYLKNYRNHRSYK